MARKPEGARAEALESAAAELPERSAETAETRVEALNVGQTIEHTRVDGETVQDVVVASNDDGTVLAREQGDGQVFLALAPGELAARDNADVQLELFGSAHDSAVESAVKASGLTGEAAKNASAALRANKSGVIARAMGENDPGAAISLAALEHASAIAKDASEPAAPTLGELQQKWSEAKTKAEQAKNDKEYGDAMKEIRAAETAMYDLRVAMHPQADAEQKSEIANQVEGAVEMTDDPLYDQGAEAVRAQIKELEEAMQAADKAKNEAAWMTARNEYDRHRVMMPILEKTDPIFEIQREVEALVEGDVASQKKEMSAGRSRVRAMRSYWRKAGAGLKGLIKSVEDGMRAIDKGPSTKKSEAEYAELAADRQEKRAKLNEIQARVEQLSAENEALKAKGIVDTEGNYQGKFEAVNNGLIDQLRDAYKANPEAVMAHVKVSLKDKKLPAHMRATLETFENYPESDPKSEPEVIPGTSFAIGDVVNVQRSSGEIDKGWKIGLVFPGVDDEKRVYVVKDAPEQPSGAVHKTIGLEQLVEWNQPGAPDVTKAPRSELIVDDQDPRYYPAVLETTEETGQEPVAQKAEIEMPKPFQPLSNEEQGMRDLVEANVLQEGGDLQGLEDSYHEVLFALEQLGLSPKSEGLPDTFDGIVNAKDERGFFGKAFGKKTARVTLAQKMFDLHYQYIDSGQVDMSVYKARAAKNQATYSEGMSRSGGR